MRAAKVQASLRICAVSPEPSLLAHTSSESRGTFRQKARPVVPLNGWACTVKICHDGMLEHKNSLDGAHFITRHLFVSTSILAILASLVRSTANCGSAVTYVIVESLILFWSGFHGFHGLLPNITTFPWLACFWCAESRPFSLLKFSFSAARAASFAKLVSNYMSLDLTVSRRPQNVSMQNFIPLHSFDLHSLCHWRRPVWVIPGFQFFSDCHWRSKYALCPRFFFFLLFFFFIFSVLFSIVWYHLTWGRESWSMCFSCICVFILHTSISVLFLFLLVSGIGCDLWLWRSLDFSINFYGSARKVRCAP